MKKIMMILFCIVFTISAKSQTFNVDSFRHNLPSYYVQNNDTLGIVISIQQAQKIDNDEELLQLFEKMNVSCDSTIKKYIAVVNEYDKKIAVMEVKISKLETISKEQTTQINNLKSQIINYQIQMDLLHQEIVSKDNIINLQEKQIMKLRFGKGAGVTGTIVGFGLFIIYALTHK